MAQPIWSTNAGSIGSYPAEIYLSVQLTAQPVAPATTITYSLISGSLPSGLSFSSSGLITGTPDLVSNDTMYTFVIRATDNLANIRDRTFSMIVSGISSPEFTTPAGDILTTLDSTWIELPITYSNPIDTNQVIIRVVQGELPPGLEINSTGLIRGYAEPPISNVNLGLVTTAITTVNSNVITCLSTTGFTLSRPIVFTGTAFSSIVANQTYYIHSIIDEFSFTISTTAGGSILALTNGVGYMTATLPNVSVGQPTVRTYSFTLKLDSTLGSDLESYSITVVNQNAPSSEGGPNFPANTRVPTIYNTRPQTYDITDDTPYFSYYVLPPNSQGYTYSPTENAYIGRISSDNIFSFKVIGHDFDSSVINYVFADLPLGLVGNTTTGWITGNPIVADNTISEFSFSVAVYKASNPSIITPYFRFSFKITNDIVGDIVWITPTNLGEIDNSAVSLLKVVAESDVSLQYRLTSGSLPPNLTLSADGEISGIVAYQPTDQLLTQGESSTFTFTVQAYSPVHAVVQSSRTFSLIVNQTYAQPTDTLYIKCTASIEDRVLLNTLLENETLIPNEYLYRPDDSNFGKATDIIYVHAYGIHANDLDAYVAAVTKNHYWRNITLGEIKTAVAKNDQGEIIYEVVYSSVIDNLINPQGISINKEIYWPRPIDLGLGPWYTTITNIYTSYTPLYTSLSPGYARLLYPNSLPNMREQVGDELGQEYNFNLYPKWMTSQQSNGSTLGFTPAWVIAYCKPGLTTLPDGTEVSYATRIKYNIENNWVTPYDENITLNQIDFKIDRFTVDKSITYDYENRLSPPAWIGLPSATPVPNPIDSKDFYVLFPRKTILPDETQY